jgi:hypothetical protein
MVVKPALILVLALALGCQARPSEVRNTVRDQTSGSEKPPPTSDLPQDEQATLDKLRPLVENHRWREASELLRKANPQSDADDAFAGDRARYFASGNFYFSLPSVPNSESMYKQFDAWRSFPGTGDSWESKEHLAYQEVASSYIEKFNARLLELRSKS